MSEDRRKDPVQRLFTIFADHLEAWLEGDELGLEALGTAIEESGGHEEDLRAAILTLRNLAGTTAGADIASVGEAPGRGALRVPGPQERESLSPEAWGFLLALRRQGSLDPGQFERVMDRLIAIGVRPIGVDLAREVAVRVAMRSAGVAASLESGAGDGEPSH